MKSLEKELLKSWQIFWIWRKRKWILKLTINSRYAGTRNVPWDTLVHFVRKKTRDQVLQQDFNTRLKMDNTDIIVLKGVPIRILCKRKECTFLTENLNRKESHFDGINWKVCSFQIAEKF